MGRCRNTIAAASLLSILVATQAGAFCYDQAGAFYQIDPTILRAISKHESNNDPSIIHYNKNGSYDVGLMGINSCHADEVGPKRWAAMRDPCMNVMTGAWLLRQCLNKYGYNWKGLGCFNSQTPVFRDKYARNIYNILIKLHPVQNQPMAVSQSLPMVASAPVEVEKANEEGDWVNNMLTKERDGAN